MANGSTILLAGDTVFGSSGVSCSSGGLAVLSVPPGLAGP